MALLSSESILTMSVMVLLRARAFRFFRGLCELEEDIVSMRSNGHMCQPAGGLWMFFKFKLDAFHWLVIGTLLLVDHSHKSQPSI